jgi:hypothetical protein
LVCCRCKSSSFAVSCSISRRAFSPSLSTAGPLPAWRCGLLEGLLDWHQSNGHLLCGHLKAAPTWLPAVRSPTPSQSRAWKL